jgi:hypothetical protein
MNRLDYDTLTLEAGAHEGPEDGMCVMEAVAFMAGEPFSDLFQCRLEHVLHDGRKHILRALARGAREEW